MVQTESAIEGLLGHLRKRLEDLTNERDTLALEMLAALRARDEVRLPMLTKQSAALLARLEELKLTCAHLVLTVGEHQGEC